MTQEGTTNAANGGSTQPHDDLRGRAGIAPIKPEYLLPVETKARPVIDDDAAEERGDSRDTRADARDQPGNKRQKTGKGGFKKRTEQRARPQGEATIKMCRAWETTGECVRGDACRFQHSWAGYWEVKPQDIHHEVAAALCDTEPYVRTMEPRLGGDDLRGKTIDLTTECPVFKDLGYCTYGWRCRFLGGHVKKHVDKEGDDQWELLGFKDPSSMSETERYNETNWPKSDTLTRLKHNKFEWTFSTKYLAKIEPDKPFALALPKGSVPNPKYGKKQKRQAAVALDEESAMNGAEMNEEEAMNAAPVAPAPAAPAVGVVDGESEAMDVPLRPEEKRRLNWENGRYLAPLTTVGNLPFRRLCVDYGATITVSEMALAQPLVTGQTEEWALMRRHHSEKMFGVQLAGGYPNRMVPAAEVIAQALGPSGVDFVDINMGAGSALMENPGRLGKILVGMNRALGEIPLTVKFRTGVAHNRPVAHKLIPKFATEWGASAMTLHGRSRQQRYSKLANWEYVRECVDVLHASCDDAGMPRVPIFGNGDCFSAQSYWEEKERSGVDGVMVARGALIKPWIFTEIAERREWDISATERLEGIRKFAEYGLSHWGSDTMGVNTTRRFLCEALSFQCRYVPIGLLERMPPMLNERPPAFRGRSELETLLSSPYVGDWIKISEMFLGPVAENFNFVPKHKSSSYGNEEAQG